MSRRVVTGGLNAQRLDLEHTFELLQDGKLPLMPVIGGVCVAAYGIENGIFYPEDYLVHSRLQVEVYGSVLQGEPPSPEVRAVLLLQKLRRPGLLGRIVGVRDIHAQMWYPEIDHPPEDEHAPDPSNESAWVL